MGYIILNGIKSTEKGLLLKSGYNIPVANETIETLSVLGRKQGELTIKTGSYPNLTFTLEFVLKNWKNSSSEMKKLTSFFFTGINDQLLINNEKYYYEVVSKSIGEINHVNGRGTIIPVTFTTRPFLKIKNDTPVTGNEIINNGVIECEPLIKIITNSFTDVTITCNGQEFLIKNANSTLFYIDSSRYIVFDNNGTLFKTIGNFPKLKVGRNSFSCNVEYEILKRELFLI